jgi:phosphohistidine phosphatase
MRLYFLRHGIAEERSPSGSDFDRRLTDEGIREMETVAQGLHKLGLRFDAILTSPLVRARQTAAIVARELNVEDVLREERGLASGAGLGDLQDVLESQPSKAHVLLVGHEPDFSGFVSRLIGGGRVKMKKAGLACVETAAIEPGAGELRWLLNPDHFRKLTE